MADEDSLLRRLRSAFEPAHSELTVADDAAVLAAVESIVITTDMLIEGVDFTNATPVNFVADKALAANLSDLAAMGATPSTFLLSLGFPPSFESQFDGFVAALARHARRYRIELVGGDLSSSERLVISITALGSLESKRSIRRSDAVEGDRIYLSRPVGGAAAGLTLLSRGWTMSADGHVAEPPAGQGKYGYAQREFASSALRRQLSPEPEVELGIRLASIAEIHACIDVSDGLSSDLSRLCKASEAGALIEYERIPQFADLDRTGATLGINSDDASLHGGEEYALLFTSTLRESELSSRLGRPVYAIGKVVKGERIVLTRSGKEVEMPIEGYDHFR